MAAVRSAMASRRLSTAVRAAFQGVKARVGLALLGPQFLDGGFQGVQAGVGLALLGP